MAEEFKQREYHIQIIGSIFRTKNEDIYYENIY